MQLQLLVLGQQQLQQQLHRLVDDRLPSSVLRPDERYQVPYRFTLVPAEDGEFRLHSLTFSLALRDDESEILSRLLPLLDGERTVDDVCRAMEPHGEEAVHQALEYLLEVGALEPAAPDAGPLSPAEIKRHQPQVAFFDQFVAPDGTPSVGSWPGYPRSGLEYQARLKQAHVTVLGLGRLGSQLVHALALAGVGTITAVDSEPVGEVETSCDSWFSAEWAGLPRSEAARRMVSTTNPDVALVAAPEPSQPGELRALLADSDVAVLCRDDINPTEYEALNAAALAARTTWTSARLSGLELQIGPTVVPFETACYTCFDLRRKSNLADLGEYRIVEEFLRRHRLRPTMLAFTPGANLLALEVLKALTWFMAPATCAHLYSLNLMTMESKLHPVLKLPRCTACGRPAQPRPTIHAWQQSAASGLA